MGPRGVYSCFLKHLDKCWWDFVHRIGPDLLDDDFL